MQIRMDTSSHRCLAPESAAPPPGRRSHSPCTQPGPAPVPSSATTLPRPPARPFIRQAGRRQSFPAARGSSERRCPSSACQRRRLHRQRRGHFRRRSLSRAAAAEGPAQSVGGAGGVRVGFHGGGSGGCGGGGSGGGEGDGDGGGGVHGHRHGPRAGVRRGAALKQPPVSLLSLGHQESPDKQMKMLHFEMDVVSQSSSSSGLETLLQNAQGWGAARGVCKREDQPTMMPVGSFPRGSSRRCVRCRMMELSACSWGKDAAKFICEKKTHPSLNCSPSSKQKKTKLVLFFKGIFYIFRISETIYVKASSLPLIKNSFR
ncbi:uncharacterized protein [Vicugna pacos]|uniref:Uncharacterized protein n=1 Tax=Vicugna pacos TaxID=30538 RepID=A0ABM5BKR0_VICPA